MIVLDILLLSINVSFISLTMMSMLVALFPVVNPPPYLLPLDVTVITRKQFRKSIHILVVLLKDIYFPVVPNSFTHLVCFI